MLAALNLGDGSNLGTADGRIALDCSIRKTRQGHYCISTTDFFFPLVDNPYLQGRIGAANVLSDLYAEGVSECDFVLMLLAACRDMPEEERTVCTREMVRGFRDACDEAGTAVTGGQTVLNPWPIIGGVATSVVSEGEFVPSDGAKVGDVVVLTKPLGTQIAVNVNQWRTANGGDGDKYWKEILERGILTTEQAENMLHDACCSMARLNKNGGRLMLEHGATSGTDVTGFGILGHAQNLTENQVEEVGIDIHTLPCLQHSMIVNDEILNFRLRVGYSAETSGGLMITIPESNSKEFIEELKAADGTESWVIGKVVKRKERTAKILENVMILEV